MTPDLRSIVDVSARVRDGEVAATELLESCLAQIDRRPDVNAYITVMREDARREAEARDAERRAGRWRGPLHGIPIAVKDLIDVAGTPTTSASAVPARVATVDAPVIARLRAAGAVILGKTNLHEFAFGTTGDESVFGPVTHPADARYSAGGSSSGSAAALAAGMAFGALGTDTGGSIRIPSAVCGTVGLKATVGEISCDAVVPLSTTLDHVGPMARTVGDVAVMYDALLPEPPRTPPPAGRPLRFGLPRTYFLDLLDDDVRRALDDAVARLRSTGHVVEDVEIAGAAWTPNVYLHIVLPEATWYHAPWLTPHASKYSPGVRLRLEMGKYILAEDYVRAMHLRDDLRASVDRALDGRDALILPSLPIPAPRLNATTVRVGDSDQPVRGIMLRLTQLFNITGHPSIALPARSSAADGWPRGVQLVGHLHATSALLQAAVRVEPQISGGPGSVGGGVG